MGGRGWGKGVINVSHPPPPHPHPEANSLACSSSSFLFRKLNDPLLVFFFAPALLSPERLCVNFQGLGPAVVMAAGTIPQVSRRAACLPEATETCQRLSACLSSKPCQCRLCLRSITVLSLRVSFRLMI